MAQNKSQDKWVKSSGNVFEDQGFEGEEAAVFKIKSDLIELEKAMRANEWNQTTAAQALGVSRPRLNRMLPEGSRQVTLTRKQV